ncbi:DoxX family protein [Modestobacter sp. URMC 112]
MSTSARALLLLFAGAGALHLVRPRTYDWMVPPELGPARLWVTGTGVAELATAALLAAPATRRAGGWSAAALLTAFVPAHLHSLRVLRHRPLPLAVAAARLPLQVPMLRAALRIARGR